MLYWSVPRGDLQFLTQLYGIVPVVVLQDAGPALDAGQDEGANVLCIANSAAKVHWERPAVW